MVQERLLVSGYWDMFTGWLHTVPSHMQTNPVLAAGMILLSTGILGSLLKSMLLKRKFSSKRKRRHADCTKSLQKLQDEIISRKLNQEKLSEITQLPLAILIEELRRGNFAPSEVLEAYQSKALQVTEKTNCVIEPINEAKQQAEDLDSDLEKRGDLYGVPVSLKDNYGVKGYDGDIGIARLVDHPFSDDAVIVKVLKHQGAIPFVKTNVPQTMISFETTNPIHGATTNPHDTSRGVGGSSGGEAALLAGGGSILGFGSDIGGSIRIPSSMCGVYGLKPTFNRLSSRGTTPLLRGQTCVRSSYGPLARDVEGLVIAMRALLVPEMFRLDPLVPSIPFRNDIFESPKPLRIGYFLYDGYFRAVPAMERGVLEAKQLLEKLGHEVVLWEYPDLGLKATAIWGKAVFGDAGAEILEMLRGDVTDSSFITVTLGLALPDFVKLMLYHLFKPLYPKMARLLQFIRGQKNVTAWWSLMTETNDFKESVASDWQQKGFDAVLSPGLGSPALPFGHSAMATGVASYTMLYNVLNFPAGSLPVTKVTKEDNAKLADYPTPNPWHRVVKRGMEGSEGLPVNVQVAALPWQEEMVLRVMSEIDHGIDE